MFFRRCQSLSNGGIGNIFLQGIRTDLEMIDDTAYISNPARKRRATHKERLQTAAYIIAEWEREAPGITSGIDPAQLQEDILRFMRESSISTIDDYEASKVKLSCDRDSFFESSGRRAAPMIEIDEYAEDWINFMYCYEAQKQDPDLSATFYDRLDPVIIDLLKQYEDGAIDSQQLCKQVVSFAKVRDASDDEKTIPLSDVFH